MYTHLVQKENILSFEKRSNKSSTLAAFSFAEKHRYSQETKITKFKLYIYVHVLETDYEITNSTQHRVLRRWFEWVQPERPAYPAAALGTGPLPSLGTGADLDGVQRRSV